MADVSVGVLLGVAQEGGGAAQSDGEGMGVSGGGGRGLVRGEGVSVEGGMAEVLIRIVLYIALFLASL